MVALSFGGATGHDIHVCLPMKHSATVLHSAPVTRELVPLAPPELSPVDLTCNCTSSMLCSPHAMLASVW